MKIKNNHCIYRVSTDTENPGITLEFFLIPGKWIIFDTLCNFVY